MKVDLFVPCIVDQFYPDIAFNTIKLLRKLNIDFHYNPEQTCCGKSTYNLGFIDEAENLANKFLKDFTGKRSIVCLSPDCASFVKNEYNNIFAETDKLNLSKKISSRVFELTDFLVNQCKIKDADAEFNAKVTYHDSCAALYKYGIKNEPRILLKNVRGLELIEMKESECSCGCGDGFTSKFKHISTEITSKKVNNALKTGAEFIVTTEPSCILNMNAYINKNKLPIKAIHIANVLASGL